MSGYQPQASLSPAALALDALFMAGKTVASHGRTHPLSNQALQALAQALEAAGLPLEFQFVGGAAFRNRVPVPLDRTTWDKAQAVAHALRQRGLHEVSFEGAPNQRALLELASILAFPAANEEMQGREVEFAGVTVRAIPGVAATESSRDHDLEVHLAAQVRLAIAEAEILSKNRGQPWEWGRALACVRRLEACVELGSVAAVRAMELTAGHWTLGRRAAAGALEALVCLKQAKADLPTRRSVASAALALGVHGFSPARSQPLATAAQAALETTLPISGGRPMEPVKARVNALLHRLKGDQTRALRPGTLPLLQLVYRLEGNRTGVQPLSVPTLADLAARECAPGSDPRDSWLGVLLEALGQLPPGSRVRLPDGRVGLVLEPADNGDPLTPKVLAAGRVVSPAAPVQPLAPAPRSPSA
jgi:hypothetical protein